jgi:hypothetical protein
VNLFTHDLNIYPKTNYTIYQDVLKNRLFKTSEAFWLGYPHESWLSFGESCSSNFNKKEKPRIIITADPELDDNNSLIRFLLYSDNLDIEGLIYASSGFHWKGDGKGTKWSVPGREYVRFGLNLCPCESWRWAKDEKFIHDIVGAYEKAYPNLKVHNPEYPAPATLKSKIRYGNIEFDGDISKDSEGSNLIKTLILDDKPGQLFITAWGGQAPLQEP